ncbi:MAG: PIN domain-containing protein [Verrucomicrobiales bacterium]
MYLLDTNVLSELIRKSPDRGVVAAVKRLDHHAAFASEVTLFELRYGAMRRDDAESFWGRLQRDLIPAVQWLPVDRGVQLRAADLAADLDRRGERIGNEDCWIAATAIEHRLTLVTRNVRHFERIPGLKIESWFEGG